ncbi:MAG: gluconate 2-dehydrogenase subunit 3 family protein [Gemmatimonadetes bacterium]|nr:gluconate 2-dehydrogenase subunit 3 family protein [Gemmatimonadota bacterium]
MRDKEPQPERSTGSTGSTGGTRGTGGDVTGTGFARRDVLRILAAAPLAVFTIACEDVDRAAQHASDSLAQAAKDGVPYTPQFYTAEEFALARVLADLVIPADERSGSASDAGVPEFLDFLMTAYPDMQEPMRTGLAWMNTASQSRFQKAFVDCAPEEQARLLDEIAYPKRAAASVKDGVTFFSRFRDLTASGFWSSRIGVKDLQYMGNVPQTAWNGCPPDALAKLGVSYT